MTVAAKAMKTDWNGYAPIDTFDELFSSPGRPRTVARSLIRSLKRLSDEDLHLLQRSIDAAMIEMGITFTVYNEGGNIDRAWPFDLIPRVLSAREWDRVEKGLVQRLTALNLFIDDLYHDQKIVKDGVLPAHILERSKNFLEQCRGIDPSHGVWAHICGSDLVRDADGTLYVLEDNLRIPSGVSYMLENRRVLKRLLPDLFEDSRIRNVDDYASQLFEMLASLSPRAVEYPEIVVVTPGIYNSAYFEHAYLAQQMGAELVEGNDLVVLEDDCVYMRAVEGLARVDVIYRRVDDAFLDPEVFRKDSVLGVPGLMRAWRAGNVAIANAPGAGVADDKVVYAYVPKVIRYYLDQDPIVPNVPTYICDDPSERSYVLANLDKLVVKPANESGGYGMLVGPHASAAERRRFAARIKADPRNYIAQPTLRISTVPTLSDGVVAPRHVDLRPFILQGERHYVTPGGLTRVALRSGSLVVNSSQGGGSKDTWVMET
ncbi:MAG: circularly permuted type 2 ATP-grasp protein [Arenicellales bacterium]